MSMEDVNEILKQGIYGVKDTKPAERKLFLTSLRERVYIALTKSQVRRKQLYSEVERLLKEREEVVVYLNGKISYDYLSKYIRLASSTNTQFTIVSNEASDSPLGLVAAAKSPVEMENIFIKDERYERDINK